MLRLFASLLLVVLSSGLFPRTGTGEGDKKEILCPIESLTDAASLPALVIQQST